MFPSQDPNAIVVANGAKDDSDILRRARGMNTAERDRQKKLDEEARRDVMMMAIATIGIMFSMGGLMVSKIDQAAYPLEKP